MAKPIEIGLELTGQDALDFINYMKNPDYSEDVIRIAGEALKELKAEGLIKSERYND